jgi:formiminoglutamase
MAHVPHCREASWPVEIAGAKFASLIERADPAGCVIGLIGLADDTGVAMNNGRPGARHGPGAFRAALARYGVAEPLGFSWPRVFDAGDIEPGADLESTHGRVFEAVSWMLDQGLFPVGIGGGHDLTYPFVKAVASRHNVRAKATGAFGGVYFDSHLDVREAPGSGMAFRRIIEDCGVRPLIARGLNPMVNSAEHAGWFVENGGKIEGWGPGRFDLPAKTWLQYFVSFDLDVLDAAFAPGVSAPRAGGWDVQTAARALELLAADPRSTCFDIMEFNPEFDVDGRTARVAAHLFLSILRGYARRTDRRHEADDGSSAE